MDEYLIAKLVGRKLNQNDLEMLLIASGNIAEELAAELETKSTESESEMEIAHSPKNFKSRSRAEIRYQNRKHKGSDRSHGKRTHGDRMYFSGRISYDGKSAKERRYEEFCNPTIDNCTMQEARAEIVAELDRKWKASEEQEWTLTKKISTLQCQIADLYAEINVLEAERKVLAKARWNGYFGK